MAPAMRLDHVQRLAAEPSRQTLVVSEHGAAASRTVASYASRSRLPGEYELAW